MDLEKRYVKEKREEFLNKEDLSLAVYTDLLILDVKMCEQILRNKKDIEGNPFSDRELFIVEKFNPLFKKELDSIYEDMNKTNEEESEELSVNDFHEFKTETIIREQSGLFHIYEVQKTAFKLTSAILDTGKDSYGNTLTPDELEQLKLVLKQIEMNIASLEGESND